MSTSLPRASALLAFCLAALFILLGILFLLAPRWGAALFGIPAPDNAGFAYLPAIGLRDLAFGLYLAALARLSDARTLATILALTALIPLGDVVIVAALRGMDSPGHLLLHGFSAAVMIGSALFIAQSANTNRGNQP